MNDAKPTADVFHLQVSSAFVICTLIDLKGVDPIVYNVFILGTATPGINVYENIDLI